MIGMRRWPRVALLLALLVTLAGGVLAVPVRAAAVSGTVTAWGWSNSGQTVAPAGLTGVIAVAAGAFHSMALKDDGTVVSWGNFNGSTFDPPPGLSGVIAIAAGYFHSMALKNDGTVVAWTNFDQQTFTPPAGLSGVTAISAGGYHSLALKADGTVAAWGMPQGANNLGQATVPARLTGMTAIAAGGGHSLALKSDGTVVGWGSNSGGQATAPPGQVGVLALAAGVNHNLAIVGVGLTVAIDGGGTVNRTPGGRGTGPYTYPAGTAVTLTAVPNPGNTFTGWTIDGAPAGGTGTLSVTTDTDHVVRATFAPVAALTVAATSGGMVGRNPVGGGTGPYTYPVGTAVTLTAVPAAGQVFVEWMLDGAVAGNVARVVVIMDVPHTVEPIFATASPAPSPAPSSAPSPLPSGPAPTFADVPNGYWAHDQIGTLAQRGITTGCGEDEQGQKVYCPERGVTRAEMATFLTRALGQDWATAPATPTFADVPADYWAYGQIEAFVKLGITTGCGTDDHGRRLFCPGRGVTRAEMAAFLDRAKGQIELANPNPTFADVPTNYWAYGWVEHFFTLGVTTGCGEDEQGRTVYCPDRGVTRAEMAVFIIRA